MPLKQRANCGPRTHRRLRRGRRPNVSWARGEPVLFHASPRRASLTSSTKHFPQHVRRHAGDVVGDAGSVLSAAAEDLTENAAEIGRAPLELPSLRAQIGADIVRGRTRLPLSPTQVRHNERSEHHQKATHLLAVEPGRTSDSLLNGFSLPAKDVSENSRAVERAWHGDIGS